MPFVLNSDGVLERVRRCPRCGSMFPATSQFFYQRPSDQRLEYCNTSGNDCHGEYWRTRSQRRRVQARVTTTRVIAGHRVGVSASRARRGVTAIERVPPQSRRFGVEIEGAYPDEWADTSNGARVSRVIRAFDAAGLRDLGWNVGSEHCGIEMRTPPLTEFAQLYTACGIARDLGINPDSECGLHVHLDGSDMTPTRVKTLVRDWHANDELLRTMVSPSRRRSSWCRKMPESMVDAMLRIPDSDQQLSRYVPLGLADYGRYFALNLAAYPSHGTIECRLHQGSHNPDKIRSWVEFLRGFWEASLTGQLSGKSFSSANEMIDAVHEAYDRVDSRFLKRRIQVLAHANEVSSATA